MPFKDAPKCGAKSKRSKNKCKNPAMANGKCRMHGGETPNGLASPHYKTGTFSNYLPAPMRDKYNEALSDPELVNVRDEISLTRTLTAERLDKLYKGESIDYIAALKSQFSLYLSELSDIKRFCLMKPVLGDDEFPEYLDVETFTDFGDDEEKTERIERANRYLTEMKEKLERAYEIADVFERVQPMLEQQRKLKEAENKRLKDLNQTITIEAAMQIIFTLADIIKRNVTDKDLRANISAELNEVVARQIG